MPSRVRHGTAKYPLRPVSLELHSLPLVAISLIGNDWIMNDGGAYTFRVGVRWALGPATSLNIEGVRLEGANDDEADQRLGRIFSARW